MVRMGFEMKKTTKLIHSGIDTKKFKGSLTTPIYHNSTIVFNSYKDFFSGQTKKIFKNFTMEDLNKNCYYI